MQQKVYNYFMQSRISAAKNLQNRANENSNSCAKIGVRSIHVQILILLNEITVLNFISRMIFWFCKTELKVKPNTKVIMVEYLTRVSNANRNSAAKE